MKRDDLLHPAVQGNKWRKLEPLVKEIQQEKHIGILTYGGPFSNHIHAVASAGQHFGFPTVGIIRGSSADLSNPTLVHAKGCGMNMFPVTKKDYDAGNSSAVIQEILSKHPGFFHLPEGGATQDAVKNCAAIASEIVEQTPGISASQRFVAVPAGTGSTAAGIIGGLGHKGATVVFPAADYGVEEQSVRTVVESTFGKTCPPFHFQTAYTFGGFAAFRPELIELSRGFLSRNGILLDPIYTSKMMWGLFDLMQHGYFPNDAVVTAVHTGGLQGWDGFKKRFGVDIHESLA
jgi:1-aminocyclopropane-1-carboxylate deaminase/D-cysteine desulfhydrase-like pyridoxal-dependent ACC family enzyme